MISRKRHGMRKKISLRSKRCQSSYCAKARAEAKKKGSLPNFLDELARKHLPRRLEKDRGNAVTEIFEINYFETMFYLR